MDPARSGEPGVLPTAAMMSARNAAATAQSLDGFTLAVEGRLVIIGMQGGTKGDPWMG